MSHGSGRAHAASGWLAALMVVQSATGLLHPDVYRDPAWVRAAWWGNDWVTLALAAPGLALAGAHARRGSVRGRLLWLGLLAYAVYGYAYYALGAALNALLPLYVALLVLAACTLGAALRRTDARAVAAAVVPTTPTRALGAYLTTVAVLLAAAWLATWAAHVFAGRPTPVEPEAFRLVAVLDLALMVPALGAGGVLLWRGRAWGPVVAATAAVQGALYLAVLTVGSLVAIARGLVAAPGEAPLWGTLAALTAAAAARLLAGVRRDAPADPRTNVHVDFRADFRAAGVPLAPRLAPRSTWRRG